MEPEKAVRVRVVCHRCNGTRQVGVTEVDQHGKRTTYLYLCAACREADGEGFIDATLSDADAAIYRLGRAEVDRMILLRSDNRTRSATDRATKRYMAALAAAMAAAAPTDTGERDA